MAAKKRRKVNKAKMAKRKRKTKIKRIPTPVAPPVTTSSTEYFIFFEGAINREATNLLYRAIQEGIRQNSSKIVIFFSSLGGNIYEGFLLANVIQNSRIPILIHATNHIDSIANVIYLSAKERSAESHAKFYMHGSSGGGGDIRQLEDNISAVRTNNTRIAYFISENTKLPLEEVKEKMEKGTTLSAQNALQCGITGQIIHREIPNNAQRQEIIYIN